MEPCPAERIKRSRSKKCGSLGLCLRNFVQSVYAMAAAPMGMPGCPELAFCTASAESMRMVLMARFSSVRDSVVGTRFSVPILTACGVDFPIGAENLSGGGHYFHTNFTWCLPNRNT